jgi:Protein of unknown function (DUF3662)/FHA domain
VNLVARFESFIERLMERSFTRATGSRLQPVEISKRLIRAMESAQSVGMEGVLVPNVYDVRLSSEDYEQYRQGRASIAGNLEANLARAARQRGFHMVGRPLVRLEVDRLLHEGAITINPHLEDVETTPQVDVQHTALLPKVSGPEHTRPSTPNLVLDGKSYAVLRSPTRLGRLPDNDIVLMDPRVSRHHAEVIQKGGRWVVRDRGSTNGIAVNGTIVKESLLKPGDTISLGGLEVNWEQ